MTNDEIISCINDLIETCKDGEMGFRTAAEGVDNLELRTLFNRCAQQRTRFAGELQNEVLRRGGDPARSGHVTAAFHRGWIDIKSVVTGKNEASIIAECERGEDSAVENYEEAMKKSLPSDLFAIVQAQYADVKTTHDTIRSLEKVTHAK